jgi:hypothetical protein
VIPRCLTEKGVTLTFVCDTPLSRRVSEPQPSHATYIWETEEYQRGSETKFTLSSCCLCCAGQVSHCGHAIDDDASAGSFCPPLNRTLPPCSTLFLTDLARYRHAPTLSCATNTPGWLSLAWHQSQWSESLHRKREICPLAFICTVNLQWSGAKAVSFLHFVCSILCAAFCRQHGPQRPTKLIVESCDGYMRNDYPCTIYTYRVGTFPACLRKSKNYKY